MKARSDQLGFFDVAQRRASVAAMKIPTGGKPKKRKSTKFPKSISETLRPYSDYVSSNLVRCKDCRTILSLKDGGKDAQFPAAYSEQSYFDEHFKQNRTAYYCESCNDNRLSAPNGETPTHIVCMEHTVRR